MKLTLRGMARLPVEGEKKRSGLRARVGRVADVVFKADSPVVVGLTVSRPGLLFVFQRKDLLLAFDRATVRADRVVVDGKQAWGSAAAKRLGVNWDETVIWRGMPVKTEGGEEMGYVRDVVFDEADGRLLGLELTEGAAVDVAVGTVELPGSLVVGWDGSHIVVDRAASRVDPDGGAAAVAGRTAAVAQDGAAKAAVAVAGGAKTAAAYTKSAAKVAARSEAGQKIGGFLKSVRDQVVDAAGVPDEDERKQKSGSDGAE
jgi:uncharacterized protein YrrD